MLMTVNGRLVELNIPVGPERDAFIRKLAATTSPEERQALVDKVKEFYESGEE